MEKIDSSISSFELVGMKKLAIKAVFLFLPFFVFIGAMNFFVDPAHLYRSEKFEEGIAKIWASGQNVGNVDNYDQALVQKFYIARQKGLPDIAIIGSSRLMQIGNNIFPNKYVTNNSVSNASLLDYLGVLFNYDKKNEFPRVIILGIDPWLLDPKSIEDSWWGSFNEDTFAFLKKLDIPLRTYSYGQPLIPPRITNLFSLSYFHESIKSIRKKIKNKPISDAYFSTNQEIADYYILLKDGRRSYPKSLRTMPVEKIDGLRTWAIHTHYEFRRPDPEWANALEKTVSYLQSKHANIVFFLSPFDPILYNSFVASAQKKFIVEVENYYRDFAKKHHLKIVGSYDPSKFALTEEDFYDAIHPSKEAVEQIFRQGWQEEFWGQWLGSK